MKAATKTTILTGTPKDWPDCPSYDPALKSWWSTVRETHKRQEDEINQLRATVNTLTAAAQSTVKTS